jgi:hypothetical protein
MRDYEGTLEAVCDGYGVQKSTVSRPLEARECSTAPAVPGATAAHAASRPAAAGRFVPEWMKQVNPHIHVPYGIGGIEKVRRLSLL